MGKEKLREISKKLIVNRVDYMSALRHNIFAYVDDKDITLKDIADSAKISYSTLNSLLYGGSNDVKLSTTIGLARALGLSLDELVGAETINSKTSDSLRICRTLPENDVFLVRWFIRYLKSLCKMDEIGKQYISVAQIECENGNLKLTSDYVRVDVSGIDKNIRSKAFFGMTMPCENYMPVYSPYDILLIANDRLPHINENALIRIDKYLYLARREVKGGIAKFFSIRDGKFRIDEKDVSEVIGYVTATILNPINKNIEEEDCYDD